MATKPPWFYRQSGVIPVRLSHGAPQILLITSRHRKRWIIPKGIVEPELTPADSAANEAWEEAGVTGRVSPDPIGHYRYQKWGGTCSVQVFLLWVEDEHHDWPEASLRRREWLGVAEAASRVREDALRAMIQAVPQGLDRLVTPSKERKGRGRTGR